ncbi:hypothetical protein E4T56_gene18288 [Termitomyces sp. T112]|nr:hypothetical protein E4T56_gene18288 [Termitomyces sp. T112]
MFLTRDNPEYLELGSLGVDGRHRGSVQEFEDYEFSRIDNGSSSFTLAQTWSQSLEDETWIYKLHSHTQSIWVQLKGSCSAQEQPTGSISTAPNSQHTLSLQPSNFTLGFFSPSGGNDYGPPGDEDDSVSSHVLLRERSPKMGRVDFTATERILLQKIQTPIINNMLTLDTFPEPEILKSWILTVYKTGDLQGYF